MATPTFSPAELTTAVSFTIKEMTGLAREIVLTSRALPYRPFSLEGTQRLKVEWYPGNPEGTGTVLGASESGTTINGYWKDLFLSGPTATGFPITLNGTQVTTADDACELLDDVRAQGQELIVQWSSKIRRGYLKRFRQEWHNLHDVQWTMEFEWISRSTTTSPAVLDGGGNTSDANGQLQGLNNQAQQTALVPGFAVPATFAQAIQTTMQAVQTGVDNAINAGTVQASGAAQPNDVTRRVIASCTTIITSGQASIDTLNAQPPRILVSSASPTAPPPDQLSLGQIVQAEAYAWASENQLRQLTRTAAIQRAALARTIQSDLLGVYQARAVEDLRDVAEAFYGSRLQWRVLLVFNELDGTELSLGQLVLVPRLTPGPGMSS